MRKTNVNWPGIVRNRRIRVVEEPFSANKPFRSLFFVERWKTNKHTIRKEDFVRIRTDFRFIILDGIFEFAWFTLSMKSGRQSTRLNSNKIPTDSSKETSMEMIKSVNYRSSQVERQQHHEVFVQQNQESDHRHWWRRYIRWISIESIFITWR